MAARAVAATPSAAATDGTIVISRQQYDGFGNLTNERASDGRCRDVGYDATYRQLATTETVYAGRLAANGCGSTALITSASYDRGFELVRVAIDMQGQTTFVEYDAFGRLSTLTRPHPHSASEPGYKGRFLSARPSVKVSYFLAGDPALSPGSRYSVIRTETQDSSDHDVDGYLLSFAYVDGLGRAIVTLNEADPSAGDGGAWIASALTEHDNKGAVRRKYLEHFVSGDLLPAGLTS